MNAITPDGISPSGVGKPISRVDGPRKVTGRATYSAEFAPDGCLHAVMVQSTIACGTITGFDLSEAQGLPGVVKIITPDNAMRLSRRKAAKQTVVAPVLQDRAVLYNGQTIALVVADTLDRAQAAAARVRVTYAAAPATLALPATPGSGKTPKDFQDGRTDADTTRGTPQRAYDAAPVRLDSTYVTPNEHHNPIEPHATIASWDHDRLTLWSSTQGIGGAHATMASMFELDPAQVQVICPYVGGGFGSKGNTWPPAVLAAMAARQTGRPVSLVLARKDMYSCNGYRPHTIQRVRLAATADGTLQAVLHDGLSQMSDPALGAFVEPVAVATRMAYACANVATTHKVAMVNAGLPTYMRAPGESSGMFALESAMDEMALQLEMDPLQFRLRNYADRDGQEDKPFSSKRLRDCYTQGASRFGWQHRTAASRSMRDGRMLVGYGMATSTYPANRMGASAKVRLNADGTALVGVATQDLGTGTYTVMTQVVAQELGLDAAQVTALLGDSRLPKAPVSGGSMTVASITPAIQKACDALRQALFRLAAADLPRAPSPHDCRLVDGVVSYPGGSRQVSDLLGKAGRPYIEASGEVNRGDGKNAHSLHSFGAQFVEVRVDPDLGEIRVARYVGVFDGGFIVNPKTARSQLLGGIVFGIGMALLEQTETDPATGRIVNCNLAEYLLPTNPDIPRLDVSFVNNVDPVINPMGARGIGELPMVGVAPAIANAVCHATGKRVRSLPIRIEDVLG